MTSAAPRLHVHHHRARYRVPAEADAADVRRVLDRALAQNAPGLLAEALGPAARNWMTEDPEAIWWLKSVDLHMTCDPALGEAAVARGWSAGLARALTRALGRGAEGDHLVRFDDRAHYLAAFARDTAAGRDGGRWYYRSFGTLTALPTGGRIREALIREPAWALPALLRLRTDGDLDAVLATLAEGDARRLLRVLLADVRAPANDSTPDSRALVTLARLYGDRLYGDRHGARPRGPWTGRPSALVLLGTLVDLTAEAPALATDPDLTGWFDAMAGLAGALDTLGTDELLGHLTDGNPGATAAAVQRLRAAGVTDLLPTLGLWRRLGADRPHTLETVIRALARMAEPPVRREPRKPASGTDTVSPSSGEGFVSRHAGVFLLLPSLVALGIDRALQQTAQGALADQDVDTPPEMPPETLPALLRLHLLARCLGVEIAPGSPVDPALALAAGFVNGDLLRLPSALERELTHRLPALYLERLHDAGRWTGRLLALEELPAHGRRWWALRDVETDFLLTVEPVEPGKPDRATALDTALEHIHRITGSPPRHVLPAGCLSPPSTPLAAAILAATDQRRLADFLTRARPLEPTAALDSPLAVALEAPAQAVLRHFGRRLPGFTWSRPRHLRRQFLTGVGATKRGPEGLEVKLPASPLALVLRLAGLDDTTFTVPWLADTPIHLTLPRERP